MKKILFVIGSLRCDSFNRIIAQEAAALIGDRAEVAYLDYADLPHMDQDLEATPPAAVTRVRQEVAAADLLWFVTPEYNGSYPGHLKTLIDWLSRAHDGKEREQLELTGKKCVLTGAGGASATSKVRGKLTELLEFVGAEVMPDHQTGVVLNMEAWTEGRLILSDEQRQALAAQVEAVLA